MLIKLKKSDVSLRHAKPSINSTYIIADYAFSSVGKYLTLVSKVLDVELIGYLSVNKIKFSLTGL